MILLDQSTNGKSSLNADLRHDASTAPRLARDNDTALFGIFAAIAKEVGRRDLADAFTRRAAGAPASTPAPATPAPHPAAERHQQAGCRLIREGRYAVAEAAFRDTIRLDRRHAHAHGNLGVAFAHQRKLSGAETAFRLAIRLDPVNVTVYVSLAACLGGSGRWGVSGGVLTPGMERRRPVGAATGMAGRERASRMLAGPLPSGRGSI